MRIAELRETRVTGMQPIGAFMARRFTRRSRDVRRGRAASARSLTTFARASGLLSTRVPHAAAIDFDVGAAPGTRSNWLHQPSAFYGVNSRELSDWTKDTRGTNAGMR
jgi:hypothetical protein